MAKFNINKPFYRLSLRVHFLRILLFILLSVASLMPLLAQEEEPEVRRAGSRIIDDTTRQIYGPTTSSYFFERDIFFDQWLLYPIDTVIRNFHWFTYQQYNQNLYQDLGNIGTAMNPVFAEVPGQIGATSGFNAYNVYWDSHSVAYYNTKSPYSNLHVLLGGKGRSRTNVTYSRNINPRWNFGFDFNAILSDKQIQRKGKGDRNVRSHYYDFFTSYNSKDSSYTALASFRRMYHRVFEFGGIKVDPDAYEYSELFEENAQPWLTQAESNVFRLNYHLYHQYKVGKGLQFYHQFDSDRQQSRFYDELDAEPNKDLYFDATVVDSVKTRDQVNFNTIRNDFGIKGSLLQLFYNGYVSLRNFDMNYKYLTDEDVSIATSGTEFYVGGRIALRLDSLAILNGHLESMLDERYLLDGSISTKWFAASIKRSVASPSFLQQAYRGGHDEWVNSFSPVESSELRGNLIYRSGKLKIYPGIRLATFRNMIFFKQGDFEDTDQTVLPVQSSGYQTLASPELSFSVALLKNTTLTSRAIYSRLLDNADNALQVPEWFVNAQLAYANVWVHGNFDFQVGVDVHWKSDYYAYGYDPVIMQFYTQQNQLVPAFPVMDVFLNAKIIRGRIFFKYSNLLKAFSKYGNVPTPFYPGVNNVFDFGFDWSFYD